MYNKFYCIHLVGLTVADCNLVLKTFSKEWINW